MNMGKEVLDITDRFKNYDKDHCWQFQIREDNRIEDIIQSNLTQEIVDNLKVTDFTFEFVPKSDKEMVGRIKQFIKRHEWLGTISNYPTHFFIAKYKDILAGVIIMDMPNSFSKLLGEKTRKIERLISRGACISWSPKNLGSSLIMYSIKWMVKNTDYRVFTAYSDPEAKELGTIYQACNFIYLGQSSGAACQYKIPSGKWVSDRYFRSRSVYKRLAVDDGIIWNKTWQDGDNILWGNMPKDIEDRVRTLSKDYMLSCEKRKLSKKHKYLYIQGANKKETLVLREKFRSLNPKLVDLPYPKERGKHN